MTTAGPVPADALSLRESVSRREWLRVGGLGALGLSLGGLHAARAADRPATGGTFGKAKHCILLYLAGGPPQHETFDPKPDAPREVRGQFNPISTSVPGIQFCELLPRTARLAHRMAVVRSMFTDVNSHSTSGYWMLTGMKHPSAAESLPPSPEDWPSLAAVVGALRPSTRSPFSAVALPELIHNNPNITWPGQDGGFMGHTWHPFVFKCNPAAARFEIEGLKLPPELSALRVNERAGLLQQLDEHFLRTSQTEAMAALTRMQQRAVDVVQSATRDRYGRHKFGQSCLLARRLIEAGVRLVQVNWPREPNDTEVGNPLWDTHQKNAERVRDVLCPQFDSAYAALLTDLHERGLLDETLVVAMGEFGRTPKHNGSGGRDHWGHCFSVALAGGGGRGGQVIGASDRHGGYPADRPQRPQDLAATIFHLLGIDPHGFFDDRSGRLRPLQEGGDVMRELA
jgi:hypothetical protein